MERKATQSKLNRYFWVICPILFLYFSVRLWLASQGKEFWMDESDTIYNNLPHNLWNLLRNGADEGQASRTPLFYIIERAWLYAWGDLPQRYWDLRFFFRIFPVAAWSLANTYLFAYLWKYFFREQKLELWRSALFAFALAQFTYSNNFGCYYAIESRPYAMWAGFSLWHFLAGWQLVRNRDQGWKNYFFASVGLVLTTYAALVQVCIATGWLVLEEWNCQKRIVWFSSRMRRALSVFLVCLALGAYYFVRRETMGFTSASFALFGDSVLEVLLKTFHHHSYHLAFVTVPLFFVVVPLYWAKRRHDLAFSCAHALLLFASTLPLYWIASRKGALFASRYVIYIMPSLSFLYLLGVVTLFSSMARWAARKTGRNVYWGILIALALVESLTRGFGLYKSIFADLHRFRARRTFAFHDAPDCTVPLPQRPWALELVSNNCRGFSAPLPANPFLPQK